MAAPETEEKTPKPKTEPKPKERGAKLLPALLGLNSVLLLAVLAAVLLRPLSGAHASPKAEASVEPPGEKSPEKSAEKSSEKSKAHRDSPPGPTIRLPDFVVHLSNNDAERYARMAFEIEVATEPDKEKVQAHLPRIRDAFLTYLSDRSVEELRGGEGISRLKQGLQQKLTEFMPGVPVRALYITDLVVQ